MGFQALKTVGQNFVSEAVGSWGPPQTGKRLLDWQKGVDAASEFMSVGLQRAMFLLTCAWPLVSECLISLFCKLPVPQETVCLDLTFSSCPKLAPPRPWLLQELFGGRVGERVQVL